MIYFDNSATTKIESSALETYNKVSETIWGNPSSLHAFGGKAFDLLEQSRRQIASLMGVHSNEIYFTSGGTEGDNWVIKGTAFEKAPYGKHIITSSVEHPAVLNAMAQLEKLGFKVTYLPVDKNGRVSADDLERSITKDTILVSVMAVNNEVGAVQPIAELAKVLERYPKIHFHVDAVQAIGKGLNDLLRNARIDFLTFSGHKFHAPRGIGFIYMKSGRRIQPLMAGGGQEKDQRSGTENLPAIAAMARALRLLLENENKKVTKQQEIKTYIYEHISQFEKVHIFSQLNEYFAPHILCFTIDGARGETIVHAFESHDIFISTTSACSSKKGTISGTLSAMKVPDDIATSAVRISLDEHNTIQEAQAFIKAFNSVYHRFEMINS